MKTIISASLIVLAQTGSFYNDTGDYLGQYQQQGSTTNYYNSTGDYLGQTQQYGNQTNIYNGTGDYKGQIIISPKNIPLLPKRR